MHAGLQTFRANGVESYDGFSRLIRATEYRGPLPVTPTMDDKQHVAGVYAKFIAESCACFLAHDGRLTHLTDVRSDDYVYFRNGGTNNYLLVMEW
ncbi:hypothetical protein BK642_13705 [Pseudomonas protegens]|nr:hypothetical protein BK639_28140 [Pseudomonas protegens]ROL97826.1 hypothetical protein BK641_26805 [Pseudomonas protegens]ROM07613.1 hypothetical protein BK642_13705 [Pseudomonas protegens]